MERINTETLISSLFSLGFDKVDTALFVYTLGKISTEDRRKKFVFEDDKFSSTFKKYIDYDGSVFKLKEGYTIETNVSQTDGFVRTLGETLYTNDSLINYLNGLDFGEIVSRKAKVYGVCTIDQADEAIFSSKEIGVLKDIDYGKKTEKKKTFVKKGSVNYHE